MCTQPMRNVREARHLRGVMYRHGPDPTGASCPMRYGKRHMTVAVRSRCAIPLWRRLPLWSPSVGRRSVAPPCPRGEGRNPDDATRTARDIRSGRWSGRARHGGSTVRTRSPAAPRTTANDGDLTILGHRGRPGRLPDRPRAAGLGGNRVRIRTARNLTEAERLLTDDVHCILLDLALTTGGRPARTPSRTTSWPRSSTYCGSRRGTPSSRSPRPRATPSTAPRPYASAPRTTSSATSWTAGC